MRKAKLILTGCLLAFALLCIAASGWTQELNGADDSALLSFRRSLAGVPEPGPAISSPSTPHERGLPASDTIHGNGTRAGYVLGHGGVIPNSESVTVGGSILFRNRDYYLDAANGALMFAEPVRISQTISVSYRYEAGKDVRRTALTAPTVQLSIGPNVAMGITCAYKAAAKNEAFDLLTYGLNLSTKLGADSSMTNMMYVSSERDAGRVSMDLLTALKRKSSAVEPKSGSMFVHNSDLHTGRLSVKLSYQDVDKDFTGFNVLKQQKAAPDKLLDQLNKEKGLQRLGFQADYDLGSGASTGIGWSTIGDDGADIVKQSLSIGNSRLKLSADVLKIDRDFKRFKDLAEKERAQWAKEAGMKRSNLQLSLAPLSGMPDDSPWNTLSLREIEDQSGKITSRSLDFAGKRFALSVRNTKVDKGFARMGSLTGADRTQMALAISQQFDPNATKPSSKDLAHVAKETGVERRNIRGDFEVGETSVGVQMLTVGDETGEVSRQRLSVQGKDYNFTGLLQDIDEGFTGVSRLAPTEVVHFGNEYGMRRMNLTGGLTLKSGLQLAASYASVKAKDAGLVKYGLSLKGKKFNVAANFQDIDPGFTRVMDLVDLDKKTMLLEQGMKRCDVTAHLQAGKSVTIDSFFYSAKHSTDDVFKRQLRNNIVISPSRGPKLTIFRNELSSGSLAAPSSLLHQKFMLDHKIGMVSFRLTQDTVNRERPTGEEHAVETQAIHFVTDPKRGTSLIGDWRSVRESDGGFENTQALTLNTKLTRALSFVGTRSVVESDETEMISQEYGVSGKVFGGLSLAAKFGETLSGGVTVAKTRELSLVPPGAKDYGVFKQVKWNLSVAQVEKAGRTFTAAKVGKLEAEVLKHKISAEYAGGAVKGLRNPIVRSFSVVGDQDSKKHLNYSFSYKVRQPYCGRALLVRRYNADWRVSPSMKLTYLYSTYNEKSRGKLDPIGIERLRLTTPLTKRLNLISQWESVDDYQRDTKKNTLSLGMSGNVSALGVLEASYGFDRVVTPTGTTTARTYKLKYDYEVSPDQFLVFSGRYTDWSGPKPADANADDVRFRLDFKTLFD